MLHSKTTLLGLALAAQVFAVACSGDKSDSVKREVSEEAGDIVNAIAPEDAKRPAPSAPPALITPEETTAAAEGAGGLIRVPISAAQTVIDKWIGTLRGNDFVDDSDILVENLVRLKAELAQPTIDKTAVSGILDILARETAQAADDAENAAVEALADALELASDGLD